MDGDKTLWDPKLICRMMETIVGKLPPELVERLLEPGNLELLEEFLRGQKEICVPNYAIVLDGEIPKPSKDWVIFQNQEQGSIIFDPTQISFFQSEAQKKGEKIRGDKLLKEAGLNLKGKKLLNALFPEWCRRHPSRIPDEWAMTNSGGTRTVAFVGTIFRDNEAHRVVRCLCRDDNHWMTPYRRLDEMWSPNEMIAVWDPFLQAVSSNSKNLIVS